MFFWNSYPFLRYTAVLVAGILIGSYTDVLPGTVLSIASLTTGVLYFVLFFYYLKRKISYALKPWLGLTGLLLVFLYGFQVCLYSKIHLTRQDTQNLNDSELYAGIVISDREDRKNAFQYVVKITTIRSRGEWYKVPAKILLKVHKQHAPLLSYGDCIIVKGKLKEIPSALNPWDFDYREYLLKKGISRMHNVTAKDIRILRSFSLNVFESAAIQFRNACSDKLKKYIHPEREFQITASLLLGIKNNLDDDLKQAYVDTGVSHVLAVSGFHVALIYAVVMFLLGGMQKQKLGKTTSYLFAIGILWFYGFVSGFSASVMRAVVMFSFVIIAKLLNRQSQIYNTLAASAFFLLCYNPFFISDPGFLLSYIAVLGIVALQPLIYHSIHFEQLIPDKLWSLASVTIAAQIATLPLILTYFHQFPVWFLPVNMIVIPITTLILYAGSVLLLIPPFVPDNINAFLGERISQLLVVMHNGLLKMNILPGAVLSEINFSLIEMFLLYGVLISAVVFFYNHKITAVAGMTALTFLFSCHAILKKHELSHQKKFIVYQVDGQLVVGLVKGREMILISNSTVNIAAIRKKYSAHLSMLGVSKQIHYFNGSTDINHFPYANCKDFTYLVWNNKRIVISKGEDSKSLPDCDYLVKSGHALKLKTVPRCEHCIVGIPDYKYQKIKRKHRLKELNLPFHNLMTEGAFIKDL